MITKDNLKLLLTHLHFTENNYIFTKHFTQGDFELKVDFKQQLIIYPENHGLKINERQTCNFSDNENFVVLECVHRLLEKGYKPAHIELEPKFKVGHGASGGRADILVRNQQDKVLLIIECKTAGTQFEKGWKETQQDGGQLFTYVEQEKATEFVCLYASEFEQKTQTINTCQRIISLKDNADILKEDLQLTAFKDAKNLKERYKVWRDTYQLEFTEKGLFEENIQAYQIGKDKYTLAIDTKPIDAADKKGKYHQFRTLLRKYNVSRRENAFEVLVNLFLCKIVDETEHPNDLKFYWKGIAYDNYYDLVDRLQELYKTGMDKYLNQQITYISNQQIDDAFWAVKQKRNATKIEIKSIFRSLKFFNDNAFGLITISNKETFTKNAKILLELIQLWQGLRLKTKEQNQFLGDMFEFFLDNGIKQSEGQFFTPVPICKFIVSSLPLENQLKNKAEPLNTIDYACGSGHFLTEYALHIKPLVLKHKQTAPNEYYRHTIGIEKEDRLAKVAKVSAFMYGLDEIKILDADALAQNTDVKNEHFDVLIANPPFAVEDFLMTLDEADRELYKLIGAVNDIGNKNIQCFFLERAKQLLAGNGVAGIIVPSSVLSNSDAMHVQTREILLQYFDIVSIAELGSNTFGKTGTNTVVLFLRRKAQRPEPALHYHNRMLDFFENWADEQATGGGAFGDIGTVQSYCQHIDIPFVDYQSLLLGEPTVALLATELFTDYINEFTNSTEIKNLKKSPAFKTKTTTQQEKEIAKRQLAFFTEIEKQKLYYFMLANAQPNQVLVVKAPNNNNLQKQYLGYEWSGAKGSEGIQYSGGETVYDINTPMFDAHNSQNPDKINYYIAQNFMGLPINIPVHLQPHISLAPLAELLDFSRKDFSKAINLTVKKVNNLASRWALSKLGDITTMKGGNVFQEKYQGDKNANGIPFFKVSDMNSQENMKVMTIANHYVTETVAKTQIKANIFEIGTIVFPKVGMAIHTNKKRMLGLPACLDNNVMGITTTTEKVLNKYLFEYFISLVNLADIASDSNPPSISAENAYELKIPLPPLNIQQQIVTECEAIDQAVTKAEAAIISHKASKEILIGNLSGKYPNKKISEISLINPSKTEIRHIAESTVISFVEMASVSEAGFIENTVNKPLKDLRKGSYTYFAENDIIIAKITPCMENGKCALATGLSSGLGMGSSEFHVLRVNDTVLNHYLFALLNRKVVRKLAAQNMTGSSGHRRVPADFYADYRIPVPPLEIQTKLVAEIAQLEQQIATHQTTINQSASIKQTVVQKYL